MGEGEARQATPEAASAPRSEHWAFVALCVIAALAPFDLVGRRSGGILLLPLVGLTLVVGVGAIAASARTPQVSSAVRRWFEGLAASWLILLWGAVLLSPEVETSAAAAARISTLGAVAVATARLATTPSRARSLLRFVVVGALVAAVVGAIVQLNGDDLLGTSRFFGRITRLGPQDRLTRPWSHANVAAMAIGASVAGVAAIRSRRRAALAAAVLVIAMVLTYSRGGAASIVVGAVVWMVLSAGSTPGRRSYRLVGGLTALGLAVALLLPGWTGRASGDDRDDWWQVELAAPNVVTAGLGEPARFAVGIDNQSSVTWPATGDERVELSARWLEPGTDRVWGENRWPLPRDVAAGERVRVQVVLEPVTPPGRFTVVWDLVIQNRAYFRQFSGLSWVTTSAGVTSSAVTQTAPSSRIVPERDFPGRREIWQAGIDAFVAEPYAGVGPGRFGHTVSRYQRVSHGHNVLVEPLATWGAFATLPFLAMLLGALSLAWRTARSSGDVIGRAVATGLVIVAVHSMVDWPFVHIGVTIPVGILVGLAWGGASPARPEGGEAWTR